MMDAKPANGDKKNGKTQWAVWAVAAVVSVMFAFLGISWQSAIDKAEGNSEKLAQLTIDHEKDIDKLLGDNEKDKDSVILEHDADILRLDESNRSRRNDIADLEERIAVLEERTTGE